MELPKFHEAYTPILEIPGNGEVLHHTDMRKRVRDNYYSTLPDELLNKRTSTGSNVLHGSLSVIPDPRLKMSGTGVINRRSGTGVFNRESFANGANAPNVRFFRRLFSVVEEKIPVSGLYVFSFVIHAHKIESLWRGRWSGRPAVAGLQDGGQVIGGSFVVSDVHQCSEYRSNHVLQKSVGPDGETNQIAVTNAVRPLNVADGIARVGRRSLKRGAITLSRQVTRGAVHAVNIERPDNVPHPQTIQGRAGRLIEDSIFVGFRAGVVPRVKGIGHGLRGKNADVAGQYAVERASPFRRRHRFRRAKTDDLPQGMHPRVRAAGRHGCNGALGDAGKRVFNLRLNRRATGLPLPSGIGGPVVFNP